MPVYTNIQAPEQLSAVQATDTSGVLGTAGAEVISQALIDAIADRVMTKLIEKSQVVNNLQATVAGNVLDAVQGKILKDQIDSTNSQLSGKANISDVTLNQIACNVMPTATGVQYSYTHEALKNHRFIDATFPNSGIGAIHVIRNSFAVGNARTKSDNQYWGGEIQVFYDSVPGTVRFIVTWIGSSQNLGNFGLKYIDYF